MRARVRRHLVLAYVVVADTVSWAAWTPLLVLALAAARGILGMVTTT